MIHLRQSPRGSRVLLAILLGLVAAACNPPRPPSTPPAAGGPRYPDYPQPVVPPALKPTAEDQQVMNTAWAKLQSGDARGAERDFSGLLKRAPAFYPAETGLGFALLAEKQLKNAASHFAAVLVLDNRYIPAWQGQVEVQVAQGDDAGAVASLQQILAIDPKREVARSRLDMLTLRQVQSLVETGRKARESGHLDDSQSVLERAMQLSPTSTLILRELASTETARKDFGAAEAHAQQAVQIDGNDAENYATLGAALQADGKLREAATAYAQAVRLDPRPAWKATAADLKSRADTAALPPEFTAIPTAETVTRGQLAALIGMRLESVIEKSPRHVAAVATDVRGNWAESWILPVSQAGVMDVYPNHTFQPGNTVRRSDLAQYISRLLTIIASERSTDLTAWKAAKPKFADLPSTNVFYPAAALAVASGAMSADASGRFASTRPATGGEVIAAITRMEQIAGGR